MSQTGVTARVPSGSADLAATARIPIDIRRFPWIRRLATDYVFDHERLADFFAGNPAEPRAWADAIARAARVSRPRHALVELVHAQQRLRGAPAEAIAAATELANPASVAVVTGQQAGLFGGPLFTLLKALTTIRLAERVRAEHHVPAVAVFWVDAEDHDWNEVRTCGVLDAAFAPRSVSAGHPPGALAGPVASVQLNDAITAALAELEAALPSTEFTQALLGDLQRIYRPGVGMASAFAQWLERVLGPRGLVVFDAADPAAKPLVADVFATEVAQGGVTARLAAQAGSGLAVRGYHIQAAPHEGTLALFHLAAGRESIVSSGDGYLVGDRAVSKTALLEHVRRAPGEFSPNVLLRPIVQDTLFPTACYVAGPSELAYLGQLRQVYDAFSVSMPLVFQRATATLVDGNAMRFLSRPDVRFEALRAQDEAALNELLVAQLPPSLDASLQDALRTIEERMETLIGEVSRVDATLEGAARSTLARMQDDLKKLHAKTIQAAKRKDDTLRRQFRHAQAQAFPWGHPQEREIGFVSFLNKCGPGLVDRLNEALPLEMSMHWVIAV